MCGQLNDQVVSYALRALKRLEKRRPDQAAVAVGARAAAKIEGEGRTVEAIVDVPASINGINAAVEEVLKREKPDFVQIDYSLEDRTAEKRVLPLASEVKAAVLTALPFGRARLFRAVRGKEIPDWARDFSDSWAQFFLKFLLGDPRVTAVIPGTSNPEHMTDNLGAMRGPLPDQDQRRRMVTFIEAL